MAGGTRIHGGLIAHVAPELRYGANNSLGLSHIQEWTRKLLSGAPLALPALFRRLWHPIDPENHSTFAARSLGTEIDPPKRDQLRACVGRYESFVSSTVRSSTSTATHAVSAILQYEELQALFERYPSLETGVLARGLSVAVKATLQGNCGSPVSMNSIEAAQELLFTAFSQYTSGEGGTQLAPIFDVIACRHSIAILANVLSKLEPERACELFKGLEPLIIASEKSTRKCVAMGSCVATAAVTSSIRAKRPALQDPAIPKNRNDDLVKEAPELQFKSLLSVALQLQGRENISPSLYQELGTAAIAFDLGRWQQRRAQRQAGTDSDALKAQQQTPKARHAVLYQHTDSPVHFVARQSKRALKTLRSSQPHSLHTRRQLVSTLGACQVLSLTQSVTDVRSLLYSIMFIGKDDWKTAHWVTLASDEVVCGVVDRLVQHHAWAEARQVVRATLSGTGVTKEEKVDTSQLSPVLKQPDQMLQFLLESKTSERAVMGQRHSRVANVMLQSALVVLSQQQADHNKNTAPVYALHFIAAILLLLQEHNVALSTHTAQQLLFASSACTEDNTRSITSLKAAAVRDSAALQLLGWRTLFESLLLAGDDGTAVLDTCESMTAEQLVDEHNYSQSAVVAAAYSIMRAVDVTLADRLLKARKLLSRLYLAQLETEELADQLVRAIVSGFFQHGHWLQDVCSHGLLAINSLLLSAGLPFGRHLQLQLAQRKYEAACGLLRLGIPTAGAFVYKCGLERLLIADEVFARGPAGRKCIAMLAATEGPSAANALASGGMLDLIPYLSHGYVVSAGHATQPMLVEDMYEVAQSLMSEPQQRTHDLSTFLDMDAAEEDIGQVASLLQNRRAGRVHTPDWLQVHSRRRQTNTLQDAAGGENGWQPEHFSQLGLFPDPLHTGVDGFGDPSKLVYAMEQLLIVQRMIQAVPPE